MATENNRIVCYIITPHGRQRFCSAAICQRTQRTQRKERKGRTGTEVRDVRDVTQWRHYWKNIKP